MKAQIYNLIILDRSGSMYEIKKEAINGYNETLGTIKAAQLKYLDTQEHFVSLAAFCDCGVDIIYDKVPAKDADRLDGRKYEPCCGTPLYDAIGKTCKQLKDHIKGNPNANVVVTIITDGYENSSREFSAQSIKALIEAYKSEGWLFAYAGANHDVESVAFNLAIDHHLQFEKTDDDIAKMSEAMAKGRMHWCARIQAGFNDLCEDSSPEEIKISKQKASKNFFF